MTKILTIAALLAILLAGSGSDSPKSSKTAAGTGFVDIKVVSNLDVQNFQYSLKQKCLPVPGVSQLNLSEFEPLVRILLPVKEFTCTNRLAYRDFLTTLKAGQYPNLEIDIPPYSEVKSSADNTALLKNVTIMVAGVKKQYDINCIVTEADDEHQILNGGADLKLTDFGIVPPVRFMGLVRIKNEITISFEFCLRESRKLSVTPVVY